MGNVTFSESSNDIIYGLWQMRAFSHRFAKEMWNHCCFPIAIISVVPLLSLQSLCFLCFQLWHIHNTHTSHFQNTENERKPHTNTQTHKESIERPKSGFVSSFVVVWRDTFDPQTQPISIWKQYACNCETSYRVSSIDSQSMWLLPVSLRSSNSDTKCLV